MQKRAELKIYGRVQGVFFRDTCRREAQKLNLSGLVRNELDGTVQIIAEGEETNLQELIEWCKDGPEHAEVEKVEAEWREATGEFSDFYIQK